MMGAGVWAVVLDMVGKVGHRSIYFKIILYLPPRMRGTTTGSGYDSGADEKKVSPSLLTVNYAPSKPVTRFAKLQGTLCKVCRGPGLQGGAERGCGQRPSRSAPAPKGLLHATVSVFSGLNRGVAMIAGPRVWLAALARPTVAQPHGQKAERAERTID